MKFIAITATFLSALIVCATAQSLECDYSSGHGGVLFWNDGARGTVGEFGFYHFAMFQCPHQWDVVAYLKPTAEVIKLLKVGQANVNQTYSIIPEFVMRNFIDMKFKTINSELLEGFLGDPVPLPSGKKETTFDVLSIAKGVEFSLINRPTNLTYEVYLYGTEGALFKHQVVSPPEFDHIFLGKIHSEEVDLKLLKRDKPYILTFPAPNELAYRPAEEVLYGTLSVPVKSTGLYKQLAVSVQAGRQIYPGPQKLNGDGLADLTRLCGGNSKWSECVGI